MKTKCNSGVSCNVCDCVYNEDGQRCNKEKIEVSMGTNINSNVEAGRETSHHFCKSFISKTCK